MTTYIFQPYDETESYRKEERSSMEEILSYLLYVAVCEKISYPVLGPTINLGSSSDADETLKELLVVDFEERPDLKGVVGTPMS